VDNGSLTRRLQSRCSNFAVRHVHQYWAKPTADETALLGLRTGQTALIREVWLHDGNTPLVFARSILPRHSLRGAWCKLANLGTRPLGAALFADARMTRHPLTFCKLSLHHPLRKLAPQAKWARRSLFMRDGRAILVTEAFLPAVLDL
jgi:chorismate--pyruvate lyase